MYTGSAGAIDITGIRRERDRTPPFGCTLPVYPIDPWPVPDASSPRLIGVVGGLAADPVFENGFGDAAAADEPPKVEGATGGLPPDPVAAK